MKHLGKAKAHIGRKDEDNCPNTQNDEKLSSFIPKKLNK